MCFDMLWFVHLLIMIAFIVALIYIGQIWLPSVRPDGTPRFDPRLAATLRVIGGLIIFCVCVWILYSLYVCMLGGGGYVGLRAR